MNKHFITIFGLIAFAFLAVTVVKYWPDDAPLHSEETDSENMETKKDSSVVEFWKYYDKATNLRKRGQYTEAITFYRSALDIDSTHNNALYYLGNMQLAVRKFAKAEESWKRLTEKHRRSARGHLQLGDLYSCKTKDNRLFNLTLASEHFQTAAQLNREETGPQLQIAKIHIINNNYELAEQMLDDVVSSNFKSIEAYFLDGYLKWQKGNIDLAEQQLNKAITINSKSGKGSSNIGEGETKAGDSPMLSDSFQCSLLTDYINDQLRSIHKKNLTMDTVYQQLQNELQRYLD